MKSISPLVSRPRKRIPSTLQKRGFNLIEAAIVLGVVGLVIGGIWVAAASVQHRIHVNNFIVALNTTIIKMQDKLPSSMPDLWLQNDTDGTHFAVDMQLVPPDWIQGTNIISPDGWYVRIGTGTGNNCLGGGTGPSAWMILNIKQENCTEVALSLISHVDGLSMGFGPSGSHATHDNTSTWTLSWLNAACGATTNTVCLSFPRTH